MSNTSVSSGWSLLPSLSRAAAPSASASAAAAAATPSQKQQQKTSSQTPVTKCDKEDCYIEGQPGLDLKLAPSIMREMLVKTGKVSKSGKGKSAAPIYRGPIVYSFFVKGDVNGDAASMLGAQILTLCPDWTLFSALFETVRCRGINLRYAPLAGGSFPCDLGNTPRSTPPVHVPMAVCVDPASATAVPYATMVASRDWSDEKNNLLTDTSRPWKHHFIMPHRAMSGGGPGVQGATLGDWVDVGTITTATGGSSFAIYGAGGSNNGNVSFGQLVCTFDCEWSYRV